MEYSKLTTECGGLINTSLFSLMSRYNLLFFASGGGKFNYQGTKRWLEDNLDHTGELRGCHSNEFFGKDSVNVTVLSLMLSPCAGLFLGGWKSSTKHSITGLDFSLADSSLLQDNVAFVLCLDTLGQGNSLHLHVSKPPKEGTLQHAFLRELEMVMKRLGGWELGA